jgi:hypothetical protein
MIYPTEHVLLDGDPISRSCVYLVDGEPYIAEADGTVGELKKSARAAEVRRCDLAARRYRVVTEATRCR